MCLGCHDGQAWAPDVFEGHTNGYVRQAGALNELGGNGLYPAATGHTLDSTRRAPGGTFTNADGLKCTDCHSPHGRASRRLPPAITNGGYRNLYRSGVRQHQLLASGRRRRERPGPLRCSRTRPAAPAPTTTATTTSPSTSPYATASAYANFCKSCHTDFHGDMGGAEVGGVAITGGYEEFHRHPASTA